MNEDSASTELLPIGFSRTRTERQRSPLRRRLRFPILRRVKFWDTFWRSTETQKYDIVSIDKPLKLHLQKNSSQWRFVRDFGKIAGRTTRPQATSFLVYKPSGTGEFKFPAGLTWAAFFNSLESTLLANRDSPGLELVMISAETSSVETSFSFGQKLLFFSNQRAQNAYSVPKTIAALSTCLVWQWKERWIQQLSPALKRPKATLPMWEPQFPSESNIVHTSHSRSSTDNSTEPSVPGLLPLELLELEMKFPLSAPQYITDLHVYVWQPQSQVPELESLQIFLELAPHLAMHVLTICRFSSTVSALRDKGCFDVSNSDLLSGQCELLKSLSIIALHVRGLISSFLEKSCQELDYLQFESRRSPSGSKIQYLEHLKDYYRSVEIACRNNSCALSRFTNDLHDALQLPMTETESSMYTKIQGYCEDFDYLAKQGLVLGPRIQDLQKSLREQLDLRQLRLTIILGVLAGLYIPLSFVTSFFGMNIRQVGEPQPIWSNTITSTMSNVFANLTDETPNYLSMAPQLFTNSSAVLQQTWADANQAWNINMFWAIAIPLTVVTILVPLFIGGLIRFVLQFMTSKRFIWRPMFARTSLLLLIANAILLEPPLVSANTWWNSDSLQSEDLILPLVVFAILFSLVLWNLVNAGLSKDKKGVAFWLFHGGICLALGLLRAYLSGLTDELFLDDGESAPWSKYTWRSPVLVICSISYWCFLMGTWIWMPRFYYRWDRRRDKRRNQ